MGMPQCMKINSTKKCSRAELTNEQQQHATVLLGHPHKMFRFLSPDRPIFLEK